jgi:hypothetical protein
VLWGGGFHFESDGEGGVIVFNQDVLFGYFAGEWALEFEVFVWVKLEVSH